QKSLGEYESVLRRNKELNQCQNEDQANYGHRKAELKKLQDDVEEANRVFTELQAAAEEEKRCVQELKLKISEAESNKAALKPLLKQRNQECEKLSRKIVQSPKKFQVDLDRLKAKVMDMKAQLSKEDQDLLESRRLLEHTMHKADAATKAVKLAIEVKTDLDKDMEIWSEISGLTEKQADLQEAINSCHPQEEDLLERYNIRQAQRRSLTSNTDLRQQSSLQKMEDYKQYAGKLKENLKAAGNKTSMVKDKIAQVKSEVLEVQDKIAAEKEDLEKENNRLMMHVIEKLDDISEQSLLNLKTCLGGV
ncbi:kinetochore protein Nuf2-like, partial [Elysia marginata]